MNPFCPNGCKTLLQLRWRTTLVEAVVVHDGKVIQPARYGRTKFLVCPKCKVSYRAGSEIIVPKSPPKTEEEIKKQLGETKISSEDKGGKRSMSLEQLQYYAPRRVRRRIKKILKE